MDCRKTPGKKRRRGSQRNVPVEQAGPVVEESANVDETPAAAEQARPAEELVDVESQVAAEQPGKQTRPVQQLVNVESNEDSDLPLDAPVTGEPVPLDTALEILVKSLKDLEIKAEKCRKIFGINFAFDVDDIEKKLEPLRERCRRTREEGGEIPSAPSLGLDVQFQENEASRARIYRENVTPHFRFAERTFDYLMKCYGLRVPDGRVSDHQHYERFMGESVLSLCIVYRDQWRDKFKAVHKTLMQLEDFVLYCCAIPVDRGSHYFSNYLLRVAIIFEMAVYCFDNNLDYFQVAQNCAGEFVDAIFFRDEGGWQNLGIAASAIATATRPIRFIVNCPKQDVRSFAEVIERLESYASSGVINMTGREFALLRDLERQLVRIPDDKWDTLREFMDKRKENPMRKLLYSILRYFEDCLPEDYPICLNILPLSFGNFIDLDACLLGGHQYNKVLTAYKCFREGSKSEAEYRSLVECIDQEIDYRNYKYVVIKLLRFRKRLVDTPQPAKPARERPPPRYAPTKKTGAVPKRRNVKEAEADYVQFDTRHVEGFVWLYKAALPSFLHIFGTQYFAPHYEVDPSEEKDESFLIDSAYYGERKMVLQFPHSRKRMAGYLLPSRKTRLVPIDVQRRLDTYAVHKPKVKARMYKNNRAVLAVPKIPESVAGHGPVWVIQGTLAKHGNSMGKAAENMDRYKEMLRSRHFRTSRVAEADEETVQMFRFKSASETRIRMPESAVPRPLSQYLPQRPRPSGRSKKQRRKSKK